MSALGCEPGALGSDPAPPTPRPRRSRDAEPKPVLALALVQEIARAHDISSARILGRGRALEYAAARREVALALHAPPFGWSLKRIGRFLSGRDHTTILHLLKPRFCKVCQAPADHTTYAHPSAPRAGSGATHVRVVTA